jgi:hypothetical protein
VSHADGVTNPRPVSARRFLNIRNSRAGVSRDRLRWWGDRFEPAPLADCSRNDRLGEFVGLPQSQQTQAQDNVLTYHGAADRGGNYADRGGNVQETAPESLMLLLKDLETRVRDADLARVRDVECERLPGDANSQPPQDHDAKCGFACHTIVASKDYVFTAYPKR